MMIGILLMSCHHLDDEIGGKPGVEGFSRGTEVGLDGSISEYTDEGGEFSVVGVDEIGGEPSDNLKPSDCGVEEGVITLELRFGNIGRCS
jgi:hypothetical protein